MKLFRCHAMIAMSLITLFLLSPTVWAEEVDKGKIPQDQLAAEYKQLPWGCPIWDESEAIEALLNTDNTLWVDTRPESFYKTGTVKGAVLLIYDKKDKPENTLNKASLESTLQQQKAGAASTIVFFCQGPECHRSYNATYVAVTEWGYAPEQVVWFRAGYPLLLTAIKNDPKLKRKAKKLISDEGMNSL